jgi:hypothetical protein
MSTQRPKPRLEPGSYAAREARKKVAAKARKVAKLPRNLFRVDMETRDLITEGSKPAIFSIPIMKKVSAFMVSNTNSGCPHLTFNADGEYQEYDLGERDDVRMVQHIAADILRMDGFVGNISIFESPQWGFEVERKKIFSLLEIEYNTKTCRAHFYYERRNEIQYRISEVVMALLIWVFVRRTNRSYLNYLIIPVFGISSTIIIAC